MTLSSAVRHALVGVPQRPQPDVCTAMFHFPPAFAGFSGHFPGNPLLPGIAQIMSVALAVHPEGPARICKIRRTKFLAMVKPGDTMTVEAHLRPQTRMARTACTAHMGDTGESKHTGENTTVQEMLVSATCTTDTGVCAHIELTMVMA